MLGVSSQSENFGRIILRNVVECGYPLDRTWVVKPNGETIDGVRCVPSIAELPEDVDLLVIAFTLGPIVLNVNLFSVAGVLVVAYVARMML